MIKKKDNYCNVPQNWRGEILSTLKDVLTIADEDNLNYILIRIDYDEEGLVWEDEGGNGRTALLVKNLIKKVKSL